MKKLLSLLLVFVLVLGMIPTAFAEGTAPTMTVTADKTEVKAGDTITLTLTIDQTIENLMNFEWAIRFDAEAYKKTGSTIGGAYKDQPGGSTVVGDATMIGPYAHPELQENGLRVSGLSTLGDPITLKADMIATVTFTALETITAENAGFRITTEAMNDYDTMTMIEGGVNLVGSEINVTVKEAPAPIETYVYYADKGMIETGKDGTLLNFAPVTVSDLDSDGVLTMDDAFMAFHNAYHDKGASGYTGGGWITKFWSVETMNASYVLNNKWVYSSKEEIHDGDTMALFVYSDLSSYSDLYTYFDNLTDTAVSGTPKEFTVNGYSVFGSGQDMDAYAAPEGATVTATCGDTKLTTTVDSNGKFTLTFPSAGTYEVLVNGLCTYTADVGYYAGQTYEDAPVVPSLCTVTVAQGEQTGYTVTMGADQSTTAGETVSIPVTVGHSGDVATYNAFDMTFTYDATLLELTSTEIEGMTVTAGDGTVRVQGYGADRAVGTAPFSLTFRAKTAGATDVTLTSAKVDLSGNAINKDAPEAAIQDAVTTVTVSGYSVILPEYFTGASVAQAGEDYTFTAKDLNYNYTVSATMGGEPVEVIDNGDGTYTIKNVSGNIVVEATRTAKTYKVTVTDETGSASYAEIARYGQDYVLQVPEKSGYDITVTATVGGVPYEMIREDLPALKVTFFTINGADITGDINIVITQTAQTPTTTSITFTGSGSGDVVGGTTQTATNGTDFTFELTKDEGYDYTVTLGEEELLPGEDGKYTIPGSKLTGEALTVTVEKTAKQTLTVAATAYIQLDGKTMWLVTAAGTVSEGKVLSYDGTPMFWSEKYDAYCWLVVSELGADEVKAEAEGKIAEADAEKTAIAYDADVNETGLVDINDAQLVWDLYNAKYDDFGAVTMQKFLNADVNGDKTVNVSDAAAVIAAIS